MEVKFFFSASNCINYRGMGSFLYTHYHSAIRVRI